MRRPFFWRVSNRLHEFGYGRQTRQNMLKLILFQDESGTCDPSMFDLVVPAHADLPDLMERVVALIERSRLIRANTKILGERFHSLLRESASLHEQSVRAGVEFQRIQAKRRPSDGERVSIPCVWW